MGRPERAINPDAGPLPRFAYELRQLRVRAGSPSYRQLARRAHFSPTALSEAAGGEQLPSLAVTLAYVRACDGDPAEWEELWRNAAAEAAGDAEPPSPPYLGLVTFQPADADRFFGRDPLVADLVDKVTEHGFLGVFGPSGSGKSSLLRAGLVPALGCADPVLMTPTALPMAELSARLAPPSTVDLLVVDQFEEIFTLCRDVDERQAFIDALIEAADSTPVVIAARTDFLGHCAEFPGLVRALRDAQILVGPMSADELRQAIEQPAGRYGLKVEPELVSAALAEVQGQPGGLPLLSHALLETWRLREKNRLTLAGYRASGGVTGAIATTAERAFAELTVRGQAVARSVLLRLTHLDDDAYDLRRRAAKSEVLALGEPDETAEVLDRLAAARLVVVAGDSVELAHEAITRAWPRLGRWIAEDREAQRVRRRLTSAAADWEAVDRDAGALYRGVHLAAARELAQRPDWGVSSSALEREFLQAGLDRQMAEQHAALRHGRRLKVLAQALAALLVVCAGVTCVAVVQRRAAVHEQEIATSRQLAVQAQAMSASAPDAAATLAVSAYRAAPTAEARGALLSTAAYKPVREVYREHRGRVRAVAFDSDGFLLASAGDDATVLLRDVRDSAEPMRLRRHTGSVRALAFQPGRPLLASAGDDEQIIVWDVRTRAAARVVAVPHGRINTLAFSADGALLAAGSEDGTVTLWDTARWREIERLRRQVGAVYDVAFDGDATLLAVAGATGVLLVDRARNRSRVLRDHVGAVRVVALSRDGRTLASGGEDTQIALRTLGGAASPTFLRRHVSPVGAVGFTTDGTRLFSASGDGSVRWWAVPDGGYLTALTSRGEPFFAAALSSDGERLATGGDESVSLWRQAVPAFTGHTRPPDALAFTVRGDLLATTGSDETISVWGRDGRPRGTMPTASAVTALAFRPDGTLVAGDEAGTITVWDVAARKAVRRVPGNPGGVTSIAVDPGGNFAVSGGRDHSVQLTDLTGAAAPRQLPAGHTGPVNAVAFDRTGQLVASGGADGRIAVWDVGRDRPLGALVDGGSAVKTLAFSPRDPLLAAGDAAGDVVLWSMESRAEVGRVRSRAAVRSVAISADGATLAAAGSDSLVYLWEIATRRQLATLTGHTGPVNAVAFAPGEGQILASSGPDPRIVLWTLEPDDVIARICAQTLGSSCPPGARQRSLPV